MGVSQKTVEAREAGTNHPSGAAGRIFNLLLSHSYHLPKNYLQFSGFRYTKVINAVLKNGEAYVCVENVFGETRLYVPSDWKVILNVETVFGDAGKRGHCSQSEDKVLYVDGKVVFGDLRIPYT